MKPAAITLIDYFATDLALTTNRTFAADKPVQFIESEFHVDVAQVRIPRPDQANPCWQVTLEVRHQPGPDTNFAYSYRVALVGQFCVAPSVKSDDEERTVHIHGASVLYGMAREIVRALTGRGPYRPVILPTVSFYEQKPTSITQPTNAPTTTPSAPAPASPPVKTQRRATAK